MLDIEPSNLTYEPQFRENSKYVLDNNGKSAVFKAPERKDMWEYKDSIKKRQASFRNEVFTCIKQ